MKKFLLALVILAGLGYVGWRVYVKVGEAQKPPRRRGGSRAVAVAVEPVRTRTIRNTAEFTGTLLPKSRFVVAPKVPGRLMKLSVNIGDTLKHGDPIAVLDNDEYAQQVAQARAELEVCRANMAESKSAQYLAEREFKRFETLHKQKVASDTEMDEARARLRAAEAKHEVTQAQIRQRQAALKTAEVRLAYTSIQATWGDGRAPRQVAERFVDEGAMLRANDPIVSVVDTSSVIAVTNVIERDFPEVHVGQSATVMTDAYKERTFKGKIVRQAPVLSEESRQARVEIEIPNPQGLLAPGMFVRVRIQFTEHKDAVVVPIAALTRRNGSVGVFVADLKNEKARFVPIRVGITEGEFTEVLTPKLEGTVVTMGHHLLEDGGAIMLPKAKPAESGKKRAPDTDTARKPGGAKESSR